LKILNPKYPTLLSPESHLGRGQIRPLMGGDLIAYILEDAYRKLCRCLFQTPLAFKCRRMKTERYLGLTVL
jgi:hypothetical protein